MVNSVYVLTKVCKTSPISKFHMFLLFFFFFQILPILSKNVANFLVMFVFVKKYISLQNTDNWNHTNNHKLCQKN